MKVADRFLSCQGIFDIFSSSKEHCSNDKTTVAQKGQTQTKKKTQIKKKENVNKKKKTQIKNRKHTLKKENSEK